MVEDVLERKTPSIDDAIPAWTKESKLWLLVILSYFALAVSYAYAVIYFSDDEGSFGDMFGAFNAFFAGLAFIAVAVTLTCSPEAGVA